MRVKDVVKLINEKTTSNDNYIGLENVVSEEAKLITSETFTEGINSRFCSGDILFGKLRPYLAKGFIPSYSGTCSTEFFVMRPRKDYLNKYLLYIFLSHGMIDFIKNQVAGVKMPRTNWESFSAMELKLTLLSEQRAIATYLDDKCAKIDHQVEVLGAKRDAYLRLKKSVINRAVTKGLNPNVKTKDSGIDWIGEIPEHWEVVHMKRVLFFNNGKDYKKIETSEGYPVLGSGGQFTNASEYLYDGEAILFGRKGTIDKPMYINGKFWTVDTMFYAVPKTNSFAKYLFFQAKAIPLDRYSTQTALPSMTQTGLQNILICLPPLSEQRAIADYLDEKCARIDAIVGNIDKQIEKYKELKRSLIDDVVTGRRVVKPSNQA